MNAIAITGNLCKDIELRYTGNGKAVLENTVAVRKEKKNKDGEYESDFINVVMFEKKAEYLNTYGAKGDKVEVTGKLRTDTWKDESGEYHNRIYIVVDTIRILVHKEKTKPVEDDMVVITPETKDIITDDDLPF